MTKMDRTKLERMRRARLFELLRQQEDKPSSLHLGQMDDTVPPDVSRQFIDTASKSLGRRSPDRLLSLSLRGRR